MMVRSTCWSALFAATLLAAGPAFAQADQEQAEPQVATDDIAQQDSDESEGDDNEALEEAPGEEDPEEEAPGDEVGVVEEAPVAEDPVEEEEEEPGEEAPVAEDPVEEEDEEEEPGDELEALEEDPVADPEPTAGAVEPSDDFNDEQSGMAFAPAYADDRTNVRVRGNLEEGDNWSLSMGGYFRIGYHHIQADPNFELFGRNDGFAMGDARLITRGELDNGLGFVFGLDAGSRLVRTTPDSPVRESAVRMTDAYAFYAPFEFLEFNLGQFKAPFDAEDLISASDLLFVNRSVANRGVQDVEGFNVTGLSQRRQLGLQARGDIPVTGEDGLGVSYAAAVANGNGPNQSLNENSRLAYYGRLVFNWGDLLALGGAAFHNDRSFGDPPNQVDRTTFGWTADLQANAYGLSVLANVLGQTEEVPDVEQDPRTAGLGYQLQLGYELAFFPELQPTYRFAYYDPTAVHGGDEEDDFFEYDALTYHTIGLNYNADDYPVRLMANYTITVEDERRQLDNNRLDLLFQLQW